MVNWRGFGRRAKNAFKPRLTTEGLREIVSNYLTENSFDFENVAPRSIDRIDFIVSTKGYKIPIRVDGYKPLVFNVIGVSSYCSRSGNFMIARPAMIYCSKKRKRKNSFVESSSKFLGVDFFYVNRSNIEETLERIIQNPKSFFSKDYIESERLKSYVKKALFGEAELGSITSALEEFKKESPSDYGEIANFAIQAVTSEIKCCDYKKEEGITEVGNMIERAGRLGLDSWLLEVLFFEEFFKNQSQLLPVKMRDLGEEDPEKHLAVSKLIEQDFRTSVGKTTNFLEIERLSAYVRSCGVAPDEIVREKINSMMSTHRERVKELKKFKEKFE